jgi:hypothetical protein
MVIKWSNILHCKSLQNLPKLGFGMFSGSNKWTCLFIGVYSDLKEIVETCISTRYMHRSMN